MLKNRLLFILVALLTLASCGNNNEEPNIEKGIELKEGTQTNQTIYADQTSGTNDGIKFTTTGPWQAKVTEVTTAKAADDNKVEWITLSQYSGDKAGDYTLTLTLQENYTSLDRKAEIRIVSGATTIVITIEQKGTTKDGEKPKPTIPVSSLSINKEAITLDIEQKEKLTATILPEDATNKDVTWSTSDENIATVNTTTGEITAIATGTAIITVTSSGDETKTASCTVTVPEPIDRENMKVSSINGAKIDYADDDHVFNKIGENPYSNKRINDTHWSYVNDAKTGRYDGWRCYFTYGNNGKIDYTDYYYYSDTTTPTKTKYEWEGDKLTIVYDHDYSENREDYGMFMTVEYGNTEYLKGNVDMNWLVANSVYANANFKTPWESAIGVKSIPYNKLINKIVVKDNNGDKYSATLTYRYEFDEYGYITTIFETTKSEFGANEEVKRYTFEYE